MSTTGHSRGTCRATRSRTVTARTTRSSRSSSPAWHATCCWRQVATCSTARARWGMRSTRHTCSRCVPGSRSGSLRDVALAILSAVCTAAATAVLVFTHTLPTGYDWQRDAVSDYGVGRTHPLYRTMVLLLGVAAVSLAIAPARNTDVG